MHVLYMYKYNQHKSDEHERYGFHEWHKYFSYIYIYMVRIIDADERAFKSAAASRKQQQGDIIHREAQVWYTRTRYIHLNGTLNPTVCIYAIKHYV